MRLVVGICIVVEILVNFKSWAARLAIFRAVVIQHLHGYFEVVEARRINPPNLLVVDPATQHESVQLLRGRVLGDLKQFA